MEAAFYMAILTCMVFGNSEGFQIVHVRKQQCLLENKMVSIGLCNGTNQNQQWTWTEDGKLLHVKSALCLGISNSSGGPSRSAIFVHCSQAPRWTCHEKEGYLEVEHTSLFLKKRGNKAVVQKEKKYFHSWMKTEVNKEGNPVDENLCLKKVGRGAEVSVRSIRNTAPPQTPTAFQAVPYSPERPVSNTTEAFTSSTTGNASQNHSQSQQPSLQVTGRTETSWVPWTTQPFSSTTEEIWVNECTLCVWFYRGPAHHLCGCDHLTLAPSLQGYAPSPEQQSCEEHTKRVCFTKSFDPGGLNKVISRLLEKNWIFCGVTIYAFGAGTAWALVYPKVEVLHIPGSPGAQVCSRGSEEHNFVSDLQILSYGRV